MSEAKEILVHYDGYRLLLALIPKKVGQGFQKRPIGHHHEPWHHELADAVGGDVFGLDGHIEVDAPGSLKPKVEPFVDALRKVYGTSVRLVDEGEFWSNHPGGEPARTLSGPKP